MPGGISHVEKVYQTLLFKDESLDSDILDYAGECVILLVGNHGSSDGKRIAESPRRKFLFLNHFFFISLELIKFIV